eukprot:TRINITY_DN7700_c0_g1_i1.p1 TRINITY_DN7700_c0_g1~~TRINITY_DN7700_c0_g1_i1.p1  ORF type:complete len:213 (+),score=39.20 TRINITY_DN7700_c0_g1_i1:67-705(+)
MARSALSFLFVAAFLCQHIDAVRFEVPNNGVERCIKEEFTPNTLVNAKVEISPVSDQMHLSLRIFEGSPEQTVPNVVTESKEISSSQVFSFTSQADSEYKFCFRDVPKGGYPTPTRVITLNLSEKNTDLGAVAKKENLKPIEVELKKMETSVEKLRSEFTAMKEREAVHRDTNESTNSRVAWLSILSIVIVASSGAAQVYYLRTYFKSKKLI